MFFYKMLNDDYRQVKLQQFPCQTLCNKLNKIHSVYHLLKFACKLQPCCKAYAWTGYSVNDEATSDGPIDANLNIKVH